MAPDLGGPAGVSPAAVIGAGGFIGGRLVGCLERAGIPVASFTRERPWDQHGGTARSLAAARTVFYLASSITPALADQRPDLVEADRLAFIRLLNELGRIGRRPTVVLAGSGGTAYDPSVAPPYSEDSPLGPTSRYGWAKLRLERELLVRSNAVHPVVLRLANVYGPGQRTDKGLGVVPHWLEAAAAGRPLLVLGDPLTSRDYVFVDDAVAAMITVHRAATAPGTVREDLPAVLNIGSGIPVSLACLLDAVRAAVGRDLPVEYGARRGFDRTATWLDVAAARRVLGWRARISLPAGVALTWRALPDTIGAHSSALQAVLEP